MSCNKIKLFTKDLLINYIKNCTHPVIIGWEEHFEKCQECQENLNKIITRSIEERERDVLEAIHETETKMLFALIMEESIQQIEKEYQLPQMDITKIKYQTQKLVARAGKNRKNKKQRISPELNIDRS